MGSWLRSRSTNGLCRVQHSWFIASLPSGRPRKLEKIYSKSFKGTFSGKAFFSENIALSKADAFGSTVLPCKMLILQPVRVFHIVLDTGWYLLRQYLRKMQIIGCPWIGVRHTGTKIIFLGFILENTLLQNKSMYVHKENKTLYLALKRAFLNLTP